MKKIVFAFLAIVTLATASAQDKTALKAKLASRPGDHFMLQLGSDIWTGAPDSINSRRKGLSRGANVYVMMDKPFKSNPNLSVAFGVGVGTSNVYFKNYNIGITSTTSTLPFTNLDSANRFKKYKLSTAYLEIPIELRYTKNPEKSNKSFKAALGIKVGTLVNAHTKGKTLQNSGGSTIGSYTQKLTNKSYFNSTRLAVTGRVGLGNFSLFASYQINNFLKDGVGPQIRPLQVGLNLSGL